jgi:hypothetical protein
MNKLLYIVIVCCFVFVPTIFSQAPSEVKIGTQIWITKNLDVIYTSCLVSETYSVHVANQENKKV